MKEEDIEELIKNFDYDKNDPIGYNLYDLLEHLYQKTDEMIIGMEFILFISGAMHFYFYTYDRVVDLGCCAIDRSEIEYFKNIEHDKWHFETILPYAYD